MEKEVYVVNNWQYIVLKECCADFGVKLHKGARVQGRQWYTLEDRYASNVQSALYLFYRNIKGK